MEIIKLLLILLKSICIKLILSPFRLIVWVVRALQVILKIIANTINFLADEIQGELNPKNRDNDTNEK